ncbi:isochorismatase family protein [Pseudomonas abyssi]|uniref:Isochorismatase n=1 Tax=Pseudomonas abyssi TaxID=170540 RepID=A0A395R0L7_9PSED|nr:isochorismatase family protein [Halopseudomonas gallaeciensis]RGP53638.1 isochorismatase [Halopseudomonas gallaeciensis]
MGLDSQMLKPAKRYALLLVDLSIGFTDPARSPLAAPVDAVIEANQTLLTAFRSRGLPVFFSTVMYDSPEQSAVFREKIPVLDILSHGSELVQIDPRVSPLDGEQVIVKHGASFFFGTDLAERLRQQQVDGVVVTGLTTSGCVRATVVDALQHDFRVLVPQEAVGDRDQGAHNANLKDMGIKYADVVNLEACLSLLA